MAPGVHREKTKMRIPTALPSGQSLLSPTSELPMPRKHVSSFPAVQSLSWILQLEPHSFFPIKALLGVFSHATSLRAAPYCLQWGLDQGHLIKPQKNCFAAVSFPGLTM